MAVEIDKKILLLNTKDIWFADYPYDVSGVSRVIFQDCKNKADVSGFCGQEFTTLTIDLAQDLDAIWKNMEPKSCRYFVNRATREGIKIKLNEGYQEFYEMNRLFRKEKKLPGLTDLAFMKKYGTLFTAELNDEILAGQLYLEDKGTIRWLIGASRRLEGDKEKATLISCGNRLIIWEAIKYASQKGLKEFDFGGYYTGEEKDEEKERINVFKKSFGGKLTTHYIYQKDYSKIFKLARWVRNRLKRKVK
jgi:lipid II:glycine glycyltransferase (peptidoglycan interpeptide bridge formation enzyme)